MKNNPDNKKKVIFSDTDVRHAQLKVRLQYDGISQSEFFRSFITGYLENDKNIVDFIEKMSQRNMKYTQRDREEAEDILGKFGIKDDELENIFDIIAKSNPEL